MFVQLFIIRNAFNWCLKLLICIYVKAIVLSTDHTQDNVDERGRILDSDGAVVSVRGTYLVDGIFPFSRSIGISLSDLFLVG